MKRRILAIMFIVAMLVSLVIVTSIGASAATHTNHCVCGATHTSVGDHTAQQSVTWTAWNGTSAITYGTNNTAYVYLSADASRSSTLEIPSGYTLYLCLHGNKLKNTAGNTRVININGGTLNLTDCSGSGTITGGIFSSGVSYENYGAGVKVTSGTFNMYGGNISENKAPAGYGGGVYVASGSSFTLYGGTISSNTTSNNGGGVYSQGTFTMYGGTISGNTANSGGGVNNGGTFNMYGGVISGNTANNIGGGVYSSYEFNLEGGSIINNTANNNPSGGIYTSQKMKFSGSPVIYGNKYGSNAGNFDICKSYTSMKVAADFAPASYPITVSIDSNYNNRLFLEAADSGIDLQDYIGYFDNISGMPLYEKDGAIYAGFAIVEDPSIENNYTVKVSSNNGLSCKWYKRVWGTKILTNDDIYASGIEYDASTQSFILTRGMLNTSISLSVGEQLIISSDSSISANISGGTTEQNGNTYTITATSDRGISIRLTCSQGVAVQFKLIGYSPVEVEGQNALKLDTTTLISGKYFCQVEWNIGGNNYSATSSDVNVLLYNVTFNANSGNVDTASKQVFGGSTYGDLPVPTRTGYTFAGWYTAADGGAQITKDTTVEITENQTLYAHWMANKYTVTFKNEDGTVLQSGQVAYGTVPSYTGATPSKAANAQYTYTFAGWDTEITAVTGNATYTATYNNTVNKYTITWNVDGAISTEEYEYGATPNFKGNTDKAANAQYTYTFAGWDTEITAVTGNATYTATYNNTVNKYTITWNVDGAISTEEYEYGATPNFKGNTDKAANAQYTYTFAGWDTEITAVTGNATYTATYNNTVNKYTVTWNVDGAISTEEYEYGATPNFKGNTDKAANAQYTYTFAGWDTEITTVTGNATYTATYSSAANSYAVSFNAGGGTINSGNVTSYTYGIGAVLPTDLTKIGYTFVGWYANEDFSGSAVAVIGNDETGNKTFFAKWNVNSYTVNFNANGGVVDTESTTVTYDSTYGALPIPTRTGHSFVGWFTAAEDGVRVSENTSVEITAEQILYAHWVKTDYNVTVGENANGSVYIIPQVTTMDNTVSVTITPDTGWEVDTVTAEGIEITKIQDNQYIFTIPAHDVIVNVTYKKIVYTISYGHENGTATGGNYSTDITAATMGDVVTVTITKNLGYLIESVILSTGEGVTDNGDGTYSFAMTASNVVVVVNFDTDVEYHIQTLIDSISAAVLELENAIKSDANATVIAEKMEALRETISNARDTIEDYEDVDTIEIESEIIAAQGTLQRAADKLNTPPSDVEDPDVQNPENDDKETSDGEQENVDSGNNDGKKGMDKRISIVVTVVIIAITIISIIVIIKPIFTK